MRLVQGQRSTRSDFPWCQSKLSLFYLPSDAAKFPRQMFSDDVQQVPKGGPPPSGPLALVLNSEENMFMEMRDLNFRAVGLFLSKEAKKITQAYEVCM